MIETTGEVPNCKVEAKLVGTTCCDCPLILDISENSFWELDEPRGWARIRMLVALRWVPGGALQSLPHQHLNVNVKIIIIIWLLVIIVIIIVITKDSEKRDSLNCTADEGNPQKELRYIINTKSKKIPDKQPVGRPKRAIYCVVSEEIPYFLGLI